MALGKEPLYSVVYRSIEAPGQGSIAIAELLARARAKNRVLGVTGMLLAEDGRFVQELEGPESIVRDLMAVIAADPRHTDVVVLAEESIDARRFPDWAMAEGRIDDAETTPPELYTDALVAARGELPPPAGPVERLVAWFRARPVADAQTSDRRAKPDS